MSDGRAQLDLRPNLATRFGLPVVGAGIAVAAAFAGFDKGAFISILWVVLVVHLTAEAWRERLVVRDDALFLRDGFWREPVLLDHLVTAEYRWSWPSRSLPRTVLRLTDVDGATVDVTLRRWSRWSDLVATVTDLSGIVPQGPRGFPVASRPWSNSV